MGASGAGFLIVEDLLEDISYSLFEPIVNTTILSVEPTGFGDGGFGDGGFGDDTAGMVVNVGSITALYVGAQVIVGRGLDTQEVVTVLQVEGGAFIAALTNTHAAGERVVGATFPVRQTSDPLFTQAEVLAYLSTALNDFLTAVPLYYEISGVIPVAPTQQNAALPSDCMFPVRVAAFGYPLRETSTSNLDSYDYHWSQQEAITPVAYFRNDSPMQTLGVWPRANNVTPLEIVYAARGPQLLGLTDGFPVPDPFLPIIRHRVLSFAYSKSGEARNPALAKYWETRFQFGIKVAQMILGVIADPNVEVSQ